jgi:opacity protein-like surface antigen
MCGISQAQNFEVYGIIQQMKGDKTAFQEEDLNVADNKLGGFGAGMNIDNINLNMAFLFGSTAVVSESIKLESKLFAVEANLDYAFITGIFSPMVSAGIGSVNFTDSFTGYENFNETNFSYNIAGGLRCVFSDHILLKALYKATWTKIKETDNAIQLDGITVHVGYIF